MMDRNVKSGLYGTYYFMQYAATKEAIQGLSRVAARAWGRFNIQVNVMNPAALSNTAEQYLADHPEHANIGKAA